MPTSIIINMGPIETLIGEVVVAFAIMWGIKKTIQLFQRS